MQHTGFQRGETFYRASGPWLCTDVGARTVVAIALPVDTRGAPVGPPYASPERVFCEADFAACWPTKAALQAAVGSDAEVASLKREVPVFCAIEQLPVEIATLFVTASRAYQRVVCLHEGQRVAALVPIEDYESLEYQDFACEQRMLRKLEELEPQLDQGSVSGEEIQAECQRVRAIWRDVAETYRAAFIRLGDR
jgi:hypothetical protein